ncbi:MAG: putative manganese-dependent inorganic diphosphatase [Lachnospiraceae bacterium]|nr:putative manganese-dependent inorganic diphosphatase [Lachnospiraceae bacterium]
MEQSPVIVIGHKNPDTDSICSAICYANLKNQMEPGRYSPKRAGKINNETTFVLNYFNMPVPDLIEDVNTQVMDIEYRKTPGVKDNISVKSAWKMMRELDVVTLPVVAKDNVLGGLITINDIAKSYMDDYESDVISKARTPYSNLVDVLEGTLVSGNPHNLIVNGKVIIGAANPHLIENMVAKDDIMIVGDRIDTQIFGIEMGVGCLILCLDAPVNSLVLQLAEERHCSVITTKLDTYTVARLINQSIPIRYFMKKNNLITFQLDETVESIKEIMSKKRHRDFPIVDDFGHYYGMVSRRNLLALRRKKVILVDHNEKSQAITGIEDAEICEIIDHHRLGSLQTISPVYFRNQPVGCTATIIYQMYVENQQPLSKEIAGLLCAAILSDTLLFRSPTCTPLDESTAKTLAEIADIDLETFAMEMFEAGSSLRNKTADELFNQDYKAFQVEDMGIGVSQISSINQRELDNVAERLQEYLKETLPSMPVQLVYVMLTNIREQCSDLLAFGPDAEKYAGEAFHVEPTDNVCHLPGVVSRKKQVVPALVMRLQEDL